ncbi:hypothetical protein D187_001531 [Cystobacter fuscus DSM 2262]|uniref:Uncharacterized protein n=1 Tax=Cystobacter fuscus (strain ATCC 25194 / DSM 2262 / NBRC 100088 / M29) TaxID=1242864 RepID=S9QHV8_CYSF2|nr:hypothetical protein [Cystobacter fuscus]EPX60879.1 hypothetical protein D187_001531 [Cystobacter fuscus DSM 2262]
MTLRERLGAVTPFLAARAFALGNLAFLGVDILLAHAANDFALAAEWVPVAFSIVAPLLLLPGLVSERLWARTRAVDVAVALGSIGVGVVGMILHLHSAFFERQSLHDLVYTAPFVAPLSYVGLGLLVLLDRMEEPTGPAWASWVVMLALGGSVGNLGLSLLDHAQNGFFSATEWIPVVTAAFGTSFLLVAMLRPARGFLWLTLGMMGVQSAVGVLGFALHVLANLRNTNVPLWDQLIFGAPIFAPLLFADISVLAAIGMWGLLRGASQSQGSLGVGSLAHASKEG